MDRMPANAPTDMDAFRSFERMGREYDHARLAHERTLAFLQTVKPEELAERLTLTLAGANWDNGTFALVGHIQNIVRDRLGELVAEAVQRLDAVVTEKRDELERLVKAPDGGKRSADGKKGNT